MNNNKDKHFQKASMYELLACFYKYTNPELHVHYYHKHLKHMRKAIESQRTQQITPPAMVRVLHASPDSPNVDVYVNETRILRDFPYKSVSNYLSLPPGTYQIDIYPAGTMVSTVLSRKITVKSGQILTLAAAGDAKNLRFVLIEDNPIVPPGQAIARFIHLSPDAPAVDVAVEGGDVLFGNIAFKKSSGAQTLAPMTTNLEVRAANTDTVVLSLPNVQLQPNASYSIYAVGFAEGTPELEALIVNP